jgi:hypothetical protein
MMNRRTLLGSLAAVIPCGFIKVSSKEEPDTLDDGRFYFDHNGFLGKRGTIYRIWGGKPVLYMKPDASLTEKRDALLDVTTRIDAANRRVFRDCTPYEGEIADLRRFVKDVTGFLVKDNVATPGEALYYFDDTMWGKERYKASWNHLSTKTEFHVAREWDGKWVLSESSPDWERVDMIPKLVCRAEGLAEAKADKSIFFRGINDIELRDLTYVLEHCLGVKA